MAQLDPSRAVQVWSRAEEGAQCDHKVRREPPRHVVVGVDREPSSSVARTRHSANGAARDEGHHRLARPRRKGVQDQHDAGVYGKSRGEQPT
jgi:hypothetical protein